VSIGDHEAIVAKRIRGAVHNRRRRYAMTKHIKTLTLAGALAAVLATPFASYGQTAPATDPYVQRRVENKAAKEEYKAKKADAKAEYKQEVGAAKSDLKAEKKQNLEELKANR
jgi:hypothetical protein